jgi:hypothetical protein
MDTASAPTRLADGGAGASTSEWFQRTEAVVEFVEKGR